MKAEGGERKADGLGDPRRVDKEAGEQGGFELPRLPPSAFRLTVVPLAESALLVRLSEEETINPALVERVAALAGAIEAAALAGVLDIVPAYTTILVSFDPRQADPAELTMAIERAADSAAHREGSATRRVTIPVVYGGEHGPDLGDVAAHTGLSSEEVIARHAGADYLVACVGFSPGFPYLLGLPPELATPRLANPRTRVPVGSVALGGQQTGVYPQATPGGWRLIGRTPLRLFDPERAEPFLLRAGDHLRFQPVAHDAYGKIEADVTSGSYQPQIDEIDGA